MSAEKAHEFDALSNMIDLLHKDDNAVKCYFGIDRKALLEEYRDKLFSSEGMHSAVDDEFEATVEMIVSVLRESEVEQVVFGRFCARWYGFLRHVFESDSRYQTICGWIVPMHFYQVFALT